MDRPHPASIQKVADCELAEFVDLAQPVGSRTEARDLPAGLLYTVVRTKGQHILNGNSATRSWAHLSEEDEQ